MYSSLSWFSDFPLYLAPMAGVSDKIFRQLCKEYGADVLTTEFVSAEGIFRRNERTREYLDFDEIERPTRNVAGSSSIFRTESVDRPFFPSRDTV